MIRSVHNKFNTRSNLTKLADNQLIAIPIIKVSNVAFKIRISDIGKVTDNNVRIFDCRKVTAQPPPLYQSTGKREIICLGKSTPINSNGVLWSSLEKEKQVVT